MDGGINVAAAMMEKEGESRQEKRSGKRIWICSKKKDGEGRVGRTIQAESFGPVPNRFPTTLSGNILPRYSVRYCSFTIPVSDSPRIGTSVAEGVALDYRDGFIPAGNSENSLVFDPRGKQEYARSIVWRASPPIDQKA